MILNFQVNSLSNSIFSKYNCHYNRIFKKIFIAPKIMLGKGLQELKKLPKEK